MFIDNVDFIMEVFCSSSAFNGTPSMCWKRSLLAHGAEYFRQKLGTDDEASEALRLPAKTQRTCNEELHSATHFSQDNR